MLHFSANLTTMLHNYILQIGICCVLSGNSAEDVRLDNLDPSEAQQYIEKQDTSLKYAPKVDSNVPAVRYLGNDPYNVLEDIYLAKQYHGQDGLGGYLYGYEVPDIAKTERKKLVVIYVVLTIILLVMDKKLKWNIGMMVLVSIKSIMYLKLYQRIYQKLKLPKKSFYVCGKNKLKGIRIRLSEYSNFLHKL